MDKFTNYDCFMVEGNWNHLFKDKPVIMGKKIVKIIPKDMNCLVPTNLDWENIEKMRLEADALNDIWIKEHPFEDVSRKGFPWLEKTIAKKQRLFNLIKKKYLGQCQLDCIQTKYLNQKIKMDKCPKCSSENCHQYKDVFHCFNCNYEEGEKIKHCVSFKINIPTKKNDNTNRTI